MTIRLLQAADYRSTPWKNGGGTTAEIAVDPEGAGIEDFDWRVSMARVEADGPFSCFVGVDRTLAVLDGDGLILTVEGRIPIGLLATSEPLQFAADVPTSARLIGGPVTDLNVMVRRGRFACDVLRMRLDSDQELAAGGDRQLIFCSEGSVSIIHAGEEFGLKARDSALVGPGAPSVMLRRRGRTELIVARLRPLFAVDQ